MKWTNTLAGILFSCSVLDMLPLSCSFSDDNFGSDSEIVGPKIVKVIHRLSGKRYSIACKVRPGLLKDETLVYWLVNDQFVMQDGRVKLREKRSGGYIITKLVFTEVLPEDSATNFSCIALNPAGFDRNNTTLQMFTRPNGGFMCGSGHL